MQTFLPYADFTTSAGALDRMRLGKQRVEAWQILRALRGETKGWVNHPATKMWRGHEYHLCIYGLEVCAEWVRRGYSDSLQEKFAEMLAEYAEQSFAPAWLGNEEFHASHRSALLRKVPEHYGKFRWDVDPANGYVWPV